MSSGAGLRTWLVEAAENERLDRFLSGRCPDLSRSRIQALIAAGLVSVNGQPARASYRPAHGDHILLMLPSQPLPPESAPVAALPPLNILYEDESILVLNKPAGLVVHPGAGTAEATLVQALITHRPEMLAEDWPAPERPGVVHRLDKDTSGILLAAVTRAAQEALQAQFKAHSIEKTYLAVLHGRLLPPEGIIDAPLGRHPTQRLKRAILEAGGRPARTRYRMMEQFRTACLVQAQPLSGRTHQIRVHFAAVGHAVVGDKLYGPRHAGLQAPRQMLHAWRISFDHPLTGARLSYEASPPDDFASLLEMLRLQEA
ncbi:MAG: RluA family pseudouridine synthase [Chloroflexi bacterium]|nr:RluA family pseudouridine synthase [Chloroflexota bacterium]